MISLSTIAFALLGGLLPALLWLWFWLKEDKKRPEPRGLIILSFIAGMVAIPFVLPLERFALVWFSGLPLLIAWATIEEVFKYLAAYIVVLRRKELDEPIDAVIYLITIALGFSALENALFLLNPLADGSIIDSILTGNLRFLGAMLLHTLSSAAIGLMIAFSFYRSKAIKRLYLLIGIILAIVLHTAFNFLIMINNSEKILIIFGFVWIGIIAVLILFEKIKRINKPTLFIRRK